MSAIRSRRLDWRRYKFLPHNLWLWIEIKPDQVAQPIGAKGIVRPCTIIMAGNDSASPPSEPAAKGKKWVA
jgi:hypothetical protein